MCLWNFKCSKIINVKDRLPENAMCTEQNSEDKNIRYQMDCYIVQTILLVIMLLFIIAVIPIKTNIGYWLQNKYWHTNNTKMENNEF